MAENTGNTIAEKNYAALMELAPDMMNGKYEYMRFGAGESFMPLTFEHLYDDRYSLMHFYTLNGDLMRDPDMEIVINHANKTVQAMTFTQHPLVFQEVEPSDTRLQRELNSFLSQWLSNIKAQEYTPERAIQNDRDGNRQEVVFTDGQPPHELLSVCISNRDVYENEGITGGEWLKLPATAEEFTAALQAVNATRDNFFVYDFSTTIPAVERLTLDEIRLAGIDELNYLAAKLEALDPKDIKTLNAAGEVIAYWDDIHHLTEYANNPEFFVLIPDAFNHIQLALHTVTATYKDGTTLTLSRKEHDAKHERLYHQHGQLQTLKPNPENADALRIVLTQVREQRNKEARPAVFKLRTSNKKPSIRKELAEGKAAAAAAPKKAAVKTKNNDLEV